MRSRRCSSIGGLTHQRTWPDKRGNIWRLRSSPHIAALMRATRAAFSTAGPLRQKTNLNPINLICSLQPLPQKYSASRFPQITLITPAPHPLYEGRIAIVTKRWDGVRWTRQRRARRHVRRAFSVSDRQRVDERRLTPLPKLRLVANGWLDGLVKEAAYGKSVWFWHPWLVSNRRRFSRAQPGLAKPSIRR